MRLKNKTALITGGNSGIGLATAKLFVAEGARVAITGRNQATLDTAATELGAKRLAIQADASDIEATEKAVTEAVENFGNLDIVFANAGIGGNTPIGNTSLEPLKTSSRPISQECSLPSRRPRPTSTTRRPSSSTAPYTASSARRDTPPTPQAKAASGPWCATSRQSSLPGRSEST